MHRIFLFSESGTRPGLSAGSLFLIFLFMSICLAGTPEALSKTSPEAKTLLKKADDCRKSLYRTDKNMRYRHYWLNCIKLYQKVYDRHSKSDQAAWAIYRSAQMFKKLYKYSGKQQDLDDAIKQYRKLAEEHLDHRLADDAQYYIGDIFYRDKRDFTQAYVEFLKVDIKFPSGDMILKAQAMLDNLAIILSKKR